MAESDNGRATEPVDYAKLNAVYGMLFTGVIVTTRKRAKAGEPIPMSELIPLSAATFALSKVIAREKIGAWVREPFVEDPAGERKPRGTRMQRAVGELLTCTRCVGAWCALGVVGLRTADPVAGRLVTNVLAASAANDFLQAGFKLVTNQSNTIEKRLEFVPDDQPARRS